ncbi:hypothetical protein JP75_08120 [Devosia riboflavina]|uniref:Uncharacterized protein n=1 Tax=Devosia riboflavina TaxID=46914 RepID=A0A087M3N9_9HYPH|nr:hypothetical protein [Devosia riboflavina]KFL31492.1 hypothetical protein JP75_08120 [Devosia riboflavina]
MTAPPEEDPLGRGKLTLSKRVDLLERDRAQQSRVLTEIVNAGKTFTPEQIAQLRAVMREEWADAGLRLDDAGHQDEAREDFRFLRRLRLTWDGSTKKVGTAVLTALIGVALIIFGSGFWQWISNAGK